MDNKYAFWHQGFFVDKQQYNFWTREDKLVAHNAEKHNVRPTPEGNAICRAVSHEAAAWIASRLNAAALAEQKLEQIRKLIGTDLGHFPYREIEQILGPKNDG